MGWWDEDCKNKKREAREELKRWRRKKVGKEGYLEKKKDYRRMCEQKKKEENEKWEKEAEQVRRECEVNGRL